MAYSITRDGNTAHYTKEPMQELLQEINARLTRIEKALGIRTPKTLAIGEHWTLTRLDLPYLRMVTYHQMDGYLMVCWQSTNVVHPRFSPIEPPTVVRLEQADGFADAKSLLDTGFRPDTTHGYLDLQQCISEAESPWPAEPIAPGPGYPEPEEIDAGMAAIEDQETRVAKNPVPRALDITYGFKIRHHEPQVREVLVSEPGTRVTNGTKTGTIKAIGGRGIQVLWDGGLRAKWFDGTGFSVV